MAGKWRAGGTKKRGSPTSGARMRGVWLAAVLATGSVVRAALMGTPIRESSFDLSRAEESLPAFLQKWTLGGNAEVVDDVVRLTLDKQGQHGWLWPVEGTGSLGREWRVDLEFQVFGAGVTLFGDGLALWLTRRPFTPRAEIGHDQPFDGMGLFFDTYDNSGGKAGHKYPWISAATRRGPDAAVETNAEGCHARIRQYGRDKKIVTARIDYHSERRQLTVKTFIGKRRGQGADTPPFGWSDCFTLSNVDLPTTGLFLGLSSTTGDLTDTHDILSLSVRGEEIIALPSPSSFPLPPPLVRHPRGREKPSDSEDGSDASRGAGMTSSLASRILGTSDPASSSSSSSSETTSSSPSSTSTSSPTSSLATAPAPAPAPGSTTGEPAALAAPTAAPLTAEELNRRLQESSTFRLMVAQGEGHRSRLQSLQSQLEKRMADLRDQLQRTMERVEGTERELLKRVDALEKELAENVDGLASEHASVQKKATWSVGAGVVLALVAVAVVIWQFSRRSKTHSL